MTTGVFIIWALMNEMFYYATSLMFVLNMRLVDRQTWFPDDRGNHPLFLAESTNSTVNNMGGPAIEITPDLVTLPCCKGHYCVHLHYKVITAITFIATTFVAPGSQVSDGRLDSIGVCPSQ